MAVISFEVSTSEQGAVRCGSGVELGLRCHPDKQMQAQEPICPRHNMVAVIQL